MHANNKNIDISDIVKRYWISFTAIMVVIGATRFDNVEKFTLLQFFIVLTIMIGLIAFIYILHNKSRFIES